ncbi:MAG TPA: hypothetical protein VJ650_12275 [Gemmatimonadaceae bacterium]|nr:hypothetical protein [Gemmatimonadaceae bacterium]
MKFRAFSTPTRRLSITVGATLFVALALPANPLAAQQPRADSTRACRTAVYYQRPSPLDSVALFDRQAALRCTGLPPGTDTLTILAAVADRGGDRDLIAYYALVVASRHFRVSRQTPERPELERTVRSLRIVHEIQPSRTTAFLLGAAAGSLAFALQESDRCSDVAGAPALLAEARRVYPVDSVVVAPHLPPDWDVFEREANERVAQVCGRETPQRSPASKP